MSTETFQWIALVLLVLILAGVFFGAYRGRRLP